MALARGHYSLDDLLIRQGEFDDIEAAGWVLAAFNMSVPKTTPPTFVVEQDDEIVAVASLYYTERNFGWLANVAVLKGMRRRGLGRTAVEACVRYAIERRLPTVWLTTMFWNRAFYEKLGFEFVPVAQVPAEVAVYRNSPKCLFMCADLRPRITTPPPAGLTGAKVTIEVL